MTYSEIIKKRNDIIAISSLKLPRKITAVVARNLAKLQAELEFYERQRRDIADKYAQKRENGEFVIINGKYVFQEEGYKKGFIAEQRELNEVDIDITLLKFSAQELDKCYETERLDILTPNQEACLAWMIDYDDVEQK